MLRNVGSHMDYTAIYPRKWQLSYCNIILKLKYCKKFRKTVSHTSVLNRICKGLKIQDVMVQTAFSWLRIGVQWQNIVNIIINLFVP
jgi:hypothetical protein